MQCTIGLADRQRQWGAVVHTIAILGVVVLMATGIHLESLGGWIARPASVIGLGEVRRVRGGRRRSWREFAWRAGWYWLRRSWMVAAVRSEALMVLVLVTDKREWAWVWLLPCVAWLWKGTGIAWAGLGRQLLYARLGQVWERGTGVALVGLGLTWIGGQVSALGGCGLGALPVGMCLSSISEPYVQLEIDEQGICHVRLRGEFEMHVDGTVEFYKRMVIIFLGLLEVPGETRPSRRTRDGRTPFVRQEEMAVWFGVTHPEISRWYDY